jgi:hypothetical protein
VVETININSVINTLKDKSDEMPVPLKEMIVDGNGILKPRLIIQTIRIKNTEIEEEKIIEQIKGWILIK